MKVVEIIENYTLEKSISSYFIHNIANRTLSPSLSYVLKAGGRPVNDLDVDISYI